jgi:CRISPR-associated endoribonuclease Cas2 subtype I-E
MTVIVANDTPDAIRGMLKRWFIEPRPNVFVGTLNRRTHEKTIEYIKRMPPASACSLSAVTRTAKASKSKLPAPRTAEASKLPACGWSPKNGRRHRIHQLRPAIFLRKFS